MLKEKYLKKLVLGSVFKENLALSERAKQTRFLRPKYSPKTNPETVDIKLCSIPVENAKF